MTLYEFNMLSHKERLATLFNEGIYIADLPFSDTRFLLYHMGTFYIEVCYKGVSNQIVGIKSFVTGKLLNKYLDEIVISEIQV